MTKTPTTSEAFRKNIQSLFSGEQNIQLTNALSRNDVFDLLAQLESVYSKIDGGNITRFLSKTQYDYPGKTYTVTVNVGTVLVINVMDLNFLFQQHTPEHIYLRERACFML